MELADTINRLCKGLHKLVENASRRRHRFKTILKDMLICEPQLLFDLAVIRWSASLSILGATEGHMDANSDVGKYFPM